MTMMIRFLLLPLCLMHLKEVAGTITLSTDSSLVELSDEVALTCKDTEKNDIEIHFGGQNIGSCILIPTTTCSIENQTLYSVSIDESPTGYNLMTLTIKSFAVSNCGEYTCLEKFDPSVKHTATVVNKLSYGDSCGTCGQCFPSNLMNCSASKTCTCNIDYTLKDNACIIAYVQYLLKAVVSFVVNLVVDLLSTLCWILNSVLFVISGKENFKWAAIKSMSWTAIKTINWAMIKNIPWKLKFPPIFGCFTLCFNCVAGGYNLHVHYGACCPWYFIVPIVLTVFFIVSTFVYIVAKKRCCGLFTTNNARFQEPTRNQPSIEPNKQGQQRPRKDDTPLDTTVGGDEEV